MPQNLNMYSLSAKLRIEFGQTKSKKYIKWEALKHIVNRLTLNIAWPAPQSKQTLQCLYRFT